MRTAVEIEETAEEKVVVDERVTDTLCSNQNLKRNLQLAEPDFEEFNKLFTCTITKTLDATEAPSDSEKLFLHKSVSRYKPDRETLKQWIDKLHASPVLLLGSCIITLIQPNSKRPSRTFSNPTLPRGKYPYNDGLSYSAAVLLWFGLEPKQEHDEASHLCGNGRCVNPAHLRWEGLGMNTSRNECHHYGCECTHNPPCIPCDGAGMTAIKEALAEQKHIKKMKLTK